MTTIRNARVENGIVLYDKDGPYLLTGCLLTNEKATKRQLLRWYWSRMKRWLRRNP